MKKTLLALLMTSPFAAKAEPATVGVSEDTTMGTMVVTLGPSLFTELQLSGSDWKMIVAARDSAAAYFVDGQVDALLIRAIEVLDRHGAKDAALDAKVAKILELNR